MSQCRVTTDIFERIANEAIDEAGFDDADTLDARHRAKYRAYMIGQEKLIAAGHIDRIAELDPIIAERIIRIWG